jgi:uncharacterized membrane-anchored protein
MNKKIILPAFVIMALVQLYVPSKMIFDAENVLTDGKEFMFKTAPIDPTDPFRGKYIMLSFDETSAQVDPKEEWLQGAPLFVNLTTDEDGFAKIESVAKEEPVGTEDYIKATVGYVFGNDSFANLSILYPFDRFYMEESKAYDAEMLYNESALDTNQVTYALVSVKKGQAVVKDVIIDGIPIREAVLQDRK